MPAASEPASPGSGRHPILSVDTTTSSYQTLGVESKFSTFTQLIPSEVVSRQRKPVKEGDPDLIRQSPEPSQ